MEHIPTIIASIFKTLLLVFDLKIADVIDAVFYRIRLLRTPGIYEVFEYESTLELKDLQGREAVHHKRLHVRFLQDNVIAFQDQAWGDGNIFARYKCSPGLPVDRYRVGNRYRMLISLRQAKQRNDVTEFQMERTITNGFRKSVEEFQIDIDHRTHFVSVNFIFPADRPPRSMMLIEQNTFRTSVLGTDCFQKLPDGRHTVSWKMKHPQLFEAYILRWVW